jgi:hypothetical protein
MLAHYSSIPYPLEWLLLIFTESAMGIVSGYSILTSWNFIEGLMDLYLLSNALLIIGWHISLLNGD